MPLYEYDGTAPELPADGSHYIAPGARVIGQVIIAPGVSVWFNAVIRADNEPTRIGRNTNIQDGAVLHNDPGFPLTIGDDVTVGHMALLHGCTIGDGTLVGMGAAVLNGAMVGRNCVIGANALITEGKAFPDRTLIVGAPARAVRTLDDAAIAQFALAARSYALKKEVYRETLKQI